MMQQSVFYNLTIPVVIENITGEDTGRRELVDILVSDDTFETSSILNGRKPPPFFFNASGLNPCEEFLHSRSYTTWFD